MTEELKNNSEKTPDQSESKWDSLDDETSFSSEKKEKTKDASKETTPTEEELKQKLVDEAKKVEEFDPNGLDIHQMHRAQFNTPRIDKEPKDASSSKQHEKLVGKKANPLSRFFGTHRVLSDIDKLLGRSISQTFGPDMYVLRNHTLGKGGYCEVKVGKETVFYAAENRSSIFGLYKASVFTNGKWRKELHKQARR